MSFSRYPSKRSEKHRVFHQRRPEIGSDYEWKTTNNHIFEDINRNMFELIQQVMRAKKEFYIKSVLLFK